MFWLGAEHLTSRTCASAWRGGSRADDGKRRAAPARRHALSTGVRRAVAARHDRAALAGGLVERGASAAEDVIRRDDAGAADLFGAGSALGGAHGAGAEHERRESAAEMEREAAHGVTSSSTW